MTYADTNVLLWLLGARNLVSQPAIEHLRHAETVLVSPMVELELQYLHELGRIRLPASDVLEHLRRGLDVQICAHPFPSVVAAAKTLTWTRDPFDRIITAQALVGDAALVTADRTIREHYSRAVW